jgi:DNA-binding response OmpR family regulator
MSGKLLIIDDDRFILNAVSDFLKKEGYHVTTAESVQETLAALHQETFDLILLDVMLPDGDGFTACRRIRARWQTPIIMLTAKGETADKVVGLEMGADDYIVKPFEPRELLARIRAQLRRTQEFSRPKEPDEKITLGDLVVDVTLHDAIIAGRPADLTHKEFELLHLLARHAGKALQKDWIFEQVWGYDAELGGKTLAVYVRRLRSKIESDPDSPRYLLTVRGFGYKLTVPTK